MGNLHTPCAFFVRVNLLCVGTLACSIPNKKRIGAAEGLIAGEVVTLLRGRLCRRLRGRLIRRRCLLCGISVVLCVFAGRAVFDLVHDDDRGTLFFVGRGIFPHILVQPAKNVDKRALLQLHFFDALRGLPECLYRQVDPALVVFGPGVIDFLADPEPNPFLREPKCRCAVIPFRDDDISCDDL